VDQAVQNQIDKDNKILDLINAIEDVIDVLISHEDLNKNGMNENQKKVCKAMLQECVNCGYFIHDYASYGFCKNFVSSCHAFINIHHNEVERWGRGLFSDVDGAIADFQKNFKELKEKFQNRTTLAIQETLLDIGGCFYSPNQQKKL